MCKRSGVKWFLTDRHSSECIGLTEDNEQVVLPPIRFSWGTAFMLAFPNLYQKWDHSAVNVIQNRARATDKA